MPIRYDIPETVWNSYTIRNIELEHLETLFEKENTRNIWNIQYLYPELQISVELKESCFEFIDSDCDKAQIE